MNLIRYIIAQINEMPLWVFIIALVIVITIFILIHKLVITIFED